MKTLGIVVLVIVVIALLVYGYKYFFPTLADGTPCDSGSGTIDGTIVNGNCVKTEVAPSGPNIDQNIGGGTANIGFQDKLVNASEITPGQNPASYFQNITASNMNSHNIILDDKHTKSNPQFIRFTSPFNVQQPQFVWYKHWLYSFNGKTQSGSGVDTYRYEVVNGLLPSQIKIFTPNQCTVFKFKISGVEYKYYNTVTENPPIGFPKTYCIYNKQ